VLSAIERDLQGRSAGQIVLAELPHGAAQGFTLRIPDHAVAEAIPLRPFHHLAIKAVEGLAAAEVTHDALSDLLGLQARELLAAPGLRGRIGMMPARDLVHGG
jgi:hypothetical protein